ncbi:MAG: DUF3473 domain-containing protein [Planctomycetia bacterium]|nr:DUF3473 domain-containing protein [Planctomycetia bacterium]
MENHRGKEERNFPQRNAMTVDVEDFYQVSAFEKYISRDDWSQYPQRIEDSTRRILEIFEQSQISATFFILGWVAQKYPFLVREIERGGHEIGLHSYSHRLIYEMTPEEFREDLRKGKVILEDILGKSVYSFRAPSFSITQRSLWALEILVEEGIRYDSSIFPIYHDRYGIPGGKVEMHEISTASGVLYEFPPSVMKFLGKNFPVSGGGYFRLYPYRFSRFCLRNVNIRAGRPFIFYIHPWEVDPQQPRLPFGSRSTQFRHRVGLSRNEGKLLRLLKDFRFSGMQDVMDAYFGLQKGT